MGKKTTKQQPQTTPQPQAKYEVIVGNIGTVYSGYDEAEANDIFATYREIASKPYGRACGCEVTLMVDGAPKLGFNPFDAGLLSYRKRLENLTNQFLRAFGYDLDRVDAMAIQGHITCIVNEISSLRAESDTHYMPHPIFHTASTIPEMDKVQKLERLMAPHPRR